jgi:hypothetical protein
MLRQSSVSSIPVDAGNKKGCGDTNQERRARRVNTSVTIEFAIVDPISKYANRYRRAPSQRLRTRQRLGETKTKTVI